MSVGNDVVDLRDPEADLRSLHPRFAERVFTAAEREMLREARQTQGEVAHRALHWALWAAKESAYKALKRRTPEAVFSPRAFEVHLPDALLILGGQAAGSVVHRGRPFPLLVRRDGDSLHAVARSLDLEYEAILCRVGMTADDPSQDARRLAAQALSSALGLDSAAVQIVRRPPEAVYRGRLVAADLSLSHHGRFVAFACASPR